MIDERMTYVYNESLKLIESLIGQGYDPLEISAIMNKISMQIYKTALDEDSYNKIVDYISESREKITKFSFEPILQ